MLDGHLENLMGLESVVIPTASSRVALPCKYMIWSRGMLARVPKGSRAAGTRLGQDEILQFGVVVGEAETLEHGESVNDALTHLRMGHRSKADDPGYISYRDSGAVRRVYPALACRGPHHSMLYMIRGLKDFQCMSNVPSLLDQAAFVLAWSQRIVRERSWFRQKDGVRRTVPLL